MVYVYNWVIHGIPGTDVILKRKKCSSLHQVKVIPGLPITKYINNKLAKVVNNCKNLQNDLKINFFQVSIFATLLMRNRGEPSLEVHFDYKHISNYSSILFNSTYSNKIVEISHILSHRFYFAHYIITSDFDNKSKLKTMER